MSDWRTAGSTGFKAINFSTTQGWAKGQVRPSMGKANAASSREKKSKIPQSGRKSCLFSTTPKSKLLGSLCLCLSLCLHNFQLVSDTSSCPPPIHPLSLLSKRTQAKRKERTCNRVPTSFLPSARSVLSPRGLGGARSEFQRSLFFRRRSPLSSSPSFPNYGPTIYH